MTQRIVYLMTGIPASGKSTFIKQHITPNQKWVSRDKVRFSIVKPSEPYFSKEKLVFKKWIQEIVESLDGGFDVFADATHINAASRHKTMSAIKSNLPAGIEVVFYSIVLQTPFTECSIRNSLRQGREKVPTSSMESMANSLVYPSAQEGIDKVYYVKVDKPIHVVLLKEAMQ